MSGARQLPMAFYVYMVRCADGSLYTGHTDDLRARLSAHRRRYVLRVHRIATSGEADLLGTVLREG